MAEFSGPWPHQADFSLDAFRRHFRTAHPSSVVSGLEVSAGTGQQIIVSGGQAWVDGLMFRSSLDPSPADVTLTAPTNTAANPRRHMVVLRLDPSDTSSGTQGSIKPAILVGAAAAAPVDPAPTQTDTGIFEMPLGSYRMPASGQPQNSTEFIDLRHSNRPVELVTTEDPGSADVVSGASLALRRRFILTPTRSGVARIDVYYSWRATGNSAGRDALIVPGVSTDWTVRRANNSSTSPQPVSLHAVTRVTAGVSVNVDLYASTDAAGVTRALSQFRANMWVE